VKKLLIAGAAALAFASVASTASATCRTCVFSQPTLAAAGTTGFAGTVMNGRVSHVSSEQNGDAFVFTDTKPAVATGAAVLGQKTGGYAQDRRNISGDLFMQAVVTAEAQVGRRGFESQATTAGSGILNGTSTGRHSAVSGSLKGESELESVALDTSWGGFETSYANQAVEGAIHAQASDRDLAVTEVDLSVFAEADAN
jgi:hypothetical protein